MPIPILAGLPWLASAIISAFTAIFTWFTSYLTRRVALVAAAVVIIIALTTGLFAALEGLLAGLSYAMPSAITEGLALVTPSNLSLCLSIIITAHMLRYAYDWNVRIVQLKLF